MISKEKLKHLYFEEGMTQGEIADELGFFPPSFSLFQPFVPGANDF
jgi:hypothetical protein